MITSFEDDNCVIMYLEIMYLEWTLLCIWSGHPGEKKYLSLGLGN